MRFPNQTGILKSFFDLDPEFQPDGQRSVTKRETLLKQAFKKEGSIIFEWLHVLPDGSHMPAEITLVRVKYGTNYVVAGYTRDLREQKRMIRELKTAQGTTIAMLDSNPHVNILFNNRFEVIDCNTSAMNFMGFKTKEEMFAGFAQRVAQSIPKVQPDGRISTTLKDRLLRAAEEGVERFETELHVGDKKRIVDIEFRKFPMKIALQ